MAASLPTMLSDVTSANSSIFSPAARVLRPRRAAPADAVRPTRAEVNLANLRHNLRVVQKAAGSATVYGVLKADGYGHGAAAVARTLERAGVGGFAVALLEEGVELREAGITSPILVMGGYYGHAWEELIARRLTPVLYEPSQVDALAAYVRLAGCPPIGAHFKVDTGMGRLGVRGPNIAPMLEAFRKHSEVEMTGFMTHLACADLPDHEANSEQVRLFENYYAQVRQSGFQPRVRHAANSAAVLSGVAAGYDLVRPGIALFGVSPVGTSHDLRPVMRVRSEVVALRDIEPGESAGYGWTWTASRKARLATVPIGYADGLPRSLSNRGHVLVRGKRAPICGAVSMDLVMIDVTDVPGAEVRDEVVVLGNQHGPCGDGEIPTTELAEHANTIPWEILTNISRRVPRFYREP